MIDFFPSRAVAVEIGSFAVHWYGIMYMLGFLMAALLLPRLQRYRGLHLPQEEWSKILTAAILGVILGGRLGFVFFYEPAYYLANPLEIVAVWKGGMASHGGFIGVSLALLWVLRKKSREDILRIADVLAVPVALGLLLGRVGNFINLELYGTVTTLPWGIEIPGVEGLRHPTQIYAVLKDALIAVVCFWHLRSTSSTRPGRTFALFLIMYGVLRFMVEVFRVQDHELWLFLTRGQLLTIPLVVIGVWLWFYSQKLGAVGGPSAVLRTSKR